MIAIGILISAAIARSILNQKAPVIAPTPTPTITVTPTPMRHVAAAATMSAFIDFEAGLSSLSATLGAVEITDSNLTPPTVELPLGFSNQ